MPLTPGSSKSVISGNIREMVAAGHPQRVAVAAALHNADKSKAKGFAMGGAPMGGLGSMQGLGGDMMGAFDNSRFGKALMSSPMGAMFGDSSGGKGSFQPPNGPTGGATAAPMMPMGQHNAPLPQGAQLPQPSSSTYGTTTAGTMSPATVPGRAAGGPTPMPWFARNEAKSMVHTGPINAAVNGRTDHIPLRVPNGSYVLPADHISHMGQSNSIAGLAKASRMFSSGPYGTSLPRMVHGRGAPSAPAAPRPPSMPKHPMFSPGGKTHEGAAVGGDDGVDIMAAGGEFVIPPEVVRMIGEGNLEHGHKILDAWVLKTRNDHKNTLAKLPRPAR